MKKHIVSSLIAICVGISAFAEGDAVRFESGKLSYEIISEADKTVAVVCRQVGYYDVVVPSNVTYNGEKYTVTVLKDGFKVNPFRFEDELLKYGEDCKKIRSIVLPNTLKEVYTYPSGVKSLTLPESVEVIGGSAFGDCQFTTAKLPPNLKKVGRVPFFKGKLPKTMTIPASLTDIDGNNMFYDCSGLQSIVVDPSNPKYCSVDGVLFNKDTTVLHGYPMDKPDIAYKVPSTVKKIESGAFHCSKLQYCIFPEGLEVIEDMAFKFSSIRSFTLPKSLKTVGAVNETVSTAFEGNSYRETKSLNGPTISLRGIKYILHTEKDFLSNKYKYYAYVTSKGNTYGTSDTYSGSVVIPATITYRGRIYTVIGLKDAFKLQNKLTSVTLGKNIQSIGNRTIDWASGMDSENWMEFQSPKLRSIMVSPYNKTFSATNGVLFDKNKKILYCYPTAKSGISYIVPSTTQVIEYGAFYDNKNLKTVTIPNSVVIIKDYAFYGCNNLTTIKIGKNVAEIGYMALPSSVKTIAVDANNPSFCSENGMLLAENKTVLLAYPASTTVENIIIPKTVNRITSTALPYIYGTATKKIVFHENVKIIENCVAFMRDGFNGEDVDGLHVYCYAKEPPATNVNEEGIMYELRSTLHVPAGCLGAYKRAKVWRKFSKIVEME